MEGWTGLKLFHPPTSWKAEEMKAAERQLVLLLPYKPHCRPSVMTISNSDTLNGLSGSCTKSKLTLSCSSQVLGSSGKTYTCLASCHYCSCPAFSFSVLRKSDSLLVRVLCHHCTHLGEKGLALFQTLRDTFLGGGGFTQNGHFPQCWKKLWFIVFATSWIQPPKTQCHFWYITFLLF